jgi:ATP-dependent exoDNAse (exonuclease V) alpha subunit
VSQAILHCFERNSVVREREILAEALRAGVGEVSVESLPSQLVEHGVLSRKIGDDQLATTPAVLAEEKSMLDFASSTKGTMSPLNSSWTIRQDWLSNDQKTAVQHVLNSTDRVIAIKGGAGTGKTSLMRETVQAIEANGQEVFTLAPSAEASRGVLKSEGFENATTVAKLLASKPLQQQVKGHVVWIDEASLLGTRTLHQVFELSKKLGFRVILSGDWKQHGSVERGTAMRLLEGHAGIKPVWVTTIQRQSESYKEAVRLVSEGHVQDGFDIVNSLRWVHEISNASERSQAIAAEFADAIGSKQSVLAVAPTHAEGNQISDAIRNELQQRQLVSSDEHSFLQLKPLRLTEAEKSDPAFYKPGDMVIFHQNAKGYRIGTRATLNSPPTAELLSQAKRFEVYRPAEISLAKGDRIRITANGMTADRKHRLNNGATYKITEFSDDGKVQLENGWLINKDYGHVAYGYVSTSHAAQGKTVDRVIIAESTMSLPAASREQFYVSLSRGRYRASIYTDSASALREAIQNSPSRMSATEFIQQTARSRQLHGHRRKALLTINQPSPPTIEQHYVQ